MTEDFLAPALEVVASGEERGDGGRSGFVDSGRGTFFVDGGVFRLELQRGERAVQALNVGSDLLQTGLGGPDLGRNIQPPFIRRVLGCGGAERQVLVAVGQLVAAQTARAVLHRRGSGQPIQARRAGRDAEGVKQALRFGQHIELDEVVRVLRP